MPAIKLLLERGVCLEPGGIGWAQRATNTSWSSIGEAVEDLAARVVVEFPDYLAGSPLLVPRTGSDSFGVRITSVQNEWWSLGETTIQVLNAAYALRAVEHHCIRLAEEYAVGCAHAAASVKTFLGENKRQPKLTMGGIEGAYIEFEALAAAVRRAFEMQKYLLWQHFGNGSCPSSFYRALPACTGLGSIAKDTLKALWDEQGAVARAYRDCSLHYTPATEMLQTARATIHSSGAAIVSYLVPDNPSAKSAGQFRFEKRIDALSRGWAFSDAILRTAEVILDARKQAAAG
jgi:hypothetical protein